MVRLEAWQAGMTHANSYNCNCFSLFHRQSQAMEDCLCLRHFAINQRALLRLSSRWQRQQTQQKQRQSKRDYLASDKIP